MKKRYMIIYYYKKEDGKYDEITEFKNAIRKPRFQEAAIILDLKRKRLVQNRLNLDTNYDTLIDYYKKEMGDHLTPHLY